MANALKGIRSEEASHAVKMARIRACNMALFFFIMPVSSFVLFATVSARPATSSGLCDMGLSDSNLHHASVLSILSTVCHHGRTRLISGCIGRPSCMRVSMLQLCCSSSCSQRSRCDGMPEGMTHRMLSNTMLKAAHHLQAHGLGCHLDVPAITYSLALLRLPQLFMATYFVRGVETFSELSISLRRLNAFLALPEPRPLHICRALGKMIKSPTHRCAVCP